MIDLSALEALLAKMVSAPWLVDDDGSAGLWGHAGSMVVTSWTESEDTAAGIVALVNAAPELLAEVRRLREEVAAFAMFVTVRTKHRSPDCTPADCAKCEAERILGEQR